MNDTTRDWLIGWLTYPKAVELFETTWLGPRNSLSPAQTARRINLIARDLRERFPSRRAGPPSAPVVPLTREEEADLAALNAVKASYDQLNAERADNASKLLRNYLAIEDVTARLIDRVTGQPFRLPGHFWTSDQAANAMSIMAGDCIWYFERFRARGPVLISEADVREKAKPAIAATVPTSTEEDAGPTARGPAKRSLGLAYKAAREFVLLPQNDGRKVKQDEVRGYVEGEGHKVADDDPGEWWKLLKADPETAGRIAGRGRPPKNPAENLPKKSRR